MAANCDAKQTEATFGPISLTPTLPGKPPGHTHTCTPQHQVTSPVELLQVSG